MSRQGEEALGKIAEELISNPVINGAIARAFEAREKAVQAQEAAMGALNLPSAADIERVTRRLRSLSQRLEGIEDAIDRLEERVAGAAGSSADDRLGRSRAGSTRSRTTSPRSPSCSRPDVIRCRERRNGSPSPTDRCTAPRPRSRPRPRGRPARPARRPSSGGRRRRSARRSRRAHTPPPPRGGRPPGGRSRPPSPPPRRRAPPMPRSLPRAGRRRGRCVATVAGRAPASTSRARSPGSGSSAPFAPSAALVPSAGNTVSAASSVPSSIDGSSAPQVPIRTSRPRAQRDQLLAHDRRARPAHAGGLHGQELSVRRGAGVAP